MLEERVTGDMVREATEPTDSVAGGGGDLPTVMTNALVGLYLVSSTVNSRLPSLKRAVVAWRRRSTRSGRASS